MCLDKLVLGAGAGEGGHPVPPALLPRREPRAGRRLQVHALEPERAQGPGTLGLASNPGPAWQAGPGFWARPSVPGPRFLRPGPWIWALGLGPLGL